MRTFIILAALCLPAWGGEGKWTPEQVLKLDPAWLRGQGLEMAPGQLWNAQTGSGLLSAAVSLGGCSASFISASGLFITNHHCLFGVLQEHSSASNDIITNGFLARTREEELPGRTTRVTVPRKFTDVTEAVLAAVPAGVGDGERFRAIEAREKQLVAECEKQPSARCRVAAFDGGVQYVQIESMELKDVRLVYAPPRAIGEYGGETDNWMWPRHTGDFSIGRAYADNVPYRPAHYLPISTTGVKPGEFVMVLGYPGTTFRSFLAEEMAERRELFYPRREEALGEYLRITEETTKGSREGEIAVAASLKSLLNVYKNAQGQIAGLDRGQMVAKQRQAEDGVVRWAGTRPEYRGALAARQELLELAARDRKTWERDFLLRSIRYGSKALAQATTLVRLAGERAKPDAERDPEYMERMLPQLRNRMEREQKNFYAKTEKALLAAFFRRLLALPEGQRVAVVDRYFATARSREEIAAKVDALYGCTKVTDLDSRKVMFAESTEQLKARKDPLLDLALEFDTALQELKEKDDARKGAVSGLRPQWRAAVLAHAGRPVAPDANGTLRVSFARVSGYKPRDGVFYESQTTLSGVLEKHTGEEPFAVPDGILRAARERRLGKWVDPKLNDVPVNFLADADTTGGNSGSPTVNGRGELVGLNFDRVWENVANDFGYNPEVCRNVNVDIRYVLWILDQVADADGLLRELGVRK